MTLSAQSEGLILQVHKFMGRLKEIVLCVLILPGGQVPNKPFSYFSLPQKSQNKVKKLVAQGKDIELIYLTNYWRKLMDYFWSL